MEVALEHLRRTRRTKTESLDRLAAIQQPIDNRLLNLKRHPTEYSWDLWVARDKIRGGLMHTKTRLENQRQQTIRDYEREVMHLQDRLVMLLNKHAQVQQDDGD